MDRWMGEWVGGLGDFLVRELKEEQEDEDEQEEGARGDGR